jgi:hypothetical protein
MWIWLPARTWFSQITAVVWLAVAFVSFIVEVSVPHFGFAFAAGAIVAAAVALASARRCSPRRVRPVIPCAGAAAIGAGTSLGGKGIPSRPRRSSAGPARHRRHRSADGTGRVNAG